MAPKIARGLSLAFGFCLPRNNDFCIHLCVISCAVAMDNMSPIAFASSPETVCSV